MTLNEGELLFCIRGALDFIDSIEPVYSVPASVNRLSAVLDARLCPFSGLISAGIAEDRLFSCLGSRDGIALLDNGVRRILYNDAMPPNRVRFTLFEELMHHYLGHTRNPAFDPMVQSYSDDEYSVYEQQAKAAACLALCPPALYFRAHPGTEQIMRSCRVSRSCAESIRRFYGENSSVIRRELAGRRQLRTYYTVR